MALRGYLLMRLGHWHDGLHSTLEAQIIMVEESYERDFLLTRLSQAMYHQLLR